MATALARQLQQLQAEHTRGKGRASLLFHARDAAEIDIPTAFGIGCNGYAELLQLNKACFAAYADNLFSERWMDLDRETTSAERNAEVTSAVTEFARAVCPYLQLKAAHKCLEWLIRRFKVHVYDIDALMEAALPHHDTTVFGRLVQLLELSSSARSLGPGSSTVGLWHFLLPNQSSGAPLPREVLTKQCLKDAAVLSFVCEVGARAAGAVGAGMAPGSTALTWLALQLTDVITKAPSVSSALVKQLLPYVFRGLRDTAAREHQSAHYLVTATLLSASRAAVIKPVFHSIASLILLYADPEQPRRALACLAAIFAGQAEHQAAGTEVSSVEGIGAASGGNGSAADAGSTAMTKWLAGYTFSSKATKSLCRLCNLGAVLSELATASDISALLSCVLPSVLKRVLLRPSEESVLRDLLAEVPAIALSPLIPRFTRHLLSRWVLIRRGGTLGMEPDAEGVEGAGLLEPGSSSGRRSSIGSQKDLSISKPTEATAALSAVMAQLGQTFSAEVDEGLRDMSTGRRGRSGSFSGLQSPVSAAVSASPSPSVDADTAEALTWAAAQLEGSSIAAVTTASSAGSHLSLRLALEHSSPVIRERAMAKIADEAAIVVQQVKALDTGRSAVAASATSDAEMEGDGPALGDRFLNLVQALQRGMQDSDARVVLHALRVHELLAAAGIVAHVLAPQEAAALPAHAACKTLARLQHLVQAHVDALMQWSSVANARVEALLPSGDESSAGAAVLTVEDAAATPGASNRRARREVSRAIRQLDNSTAKAGRTEGDAGADAHSSLSNDTMARIRNACDARHIAGTVLALLCTSVADHAHALVKEEGVPEQVSKDARKLLDRIVLALLAFVPVSTAVRGPFQYTGGALLPSDLLTTADVGSTEPVTILDLPRLALCLATRAFHPLLAGFAGINKDSMAPADVSMCLGRAAVEDARAAVNAGRHVLSARALLCLLAAASGAGEVNAVRLQWLAIRALDGTVAVATGELNSSKADGSSAGGSSATSTTSTRRGRAASVSASSAASQPGDNSAAAGLLHALMVTVSSHTSGLWRDTVAMSCMVTQQQRARAARKAAAAASGGAPSPATNAGAAVLAPAASPIALSTDAAVADSLKLLSVDADAPAASERVDSVAAAASTLHSADTAGTAAAVEARRVLLAAAHKLRARVNVLSGVWLRFGAAAQALAGKLPASDAAVSDVAAAVTAPPSSTVSSAAPLSRSMLLALVAQWIMALLSCPEDAVLFDTLQPVLSPLLATVDAAATVSAASAWAPRLQLLAGISVASTVVPALGACRALYVLQALLQSSQASAQSLLLLVPVLVAVLSASWEPTSSGADAAMLRRQALAFLRQLTQSATTGSGVKSTAMSFSDVASFYLLGASSAAADVPAVGPTAQPLLLSLAKEVLLKLESCAGDEAAAIGTVRGVVRDGMAADGAVLGRLFAAHALACAHARGAAGVNLLLFAGDSGREALWPFVKTIIMTLRDSIAAQRGYCRESQVRLVGAALQLTAMLPRDLARSIGGNAPSAEQLTLVKDIVDLLLPLFTTPAGLLRLSDGAPAPAAVAVLSAGSADLTDAGNSMVDVADDTVDSEALSSASLKASKAGDAIGVRVLQAVAASVSRELWVLAQQVPLDTSSTGAAAKPPRGGKKPAPSAAAPSATESTTTLADQLFAALLALVQRGPGEAASAARRSLYRLPLTGELVARYFASMGLASHAPAAAAAEGVVQPSFSHSAAVAGLLQSQLSALSGTMMWVRRLTVLAEVLLSALSDEDSSAKDASGIGSSQLLLSPIFLALETLCALPAALLANKQDGAGGRAAQERWDEDDVDSSLEYAKQLLLTVARNCVRILLAQPADERTPALVKDLDVHVVLHCVHATDSTQTRTAALLLLSTLASAKPAEVLQHVLPVFAAVGSSTLARDDTFSLTTLHRLVEAVVPPLRQYGPKVGVSVQSLLKVFASAVHIVPEHRQRTLFVSLVQTASGQGDKGKLLPPMVALLLAQQAVGSAASQKGSGAAGNGQASVSDLSRLLPGLAHGAAKAADNAELEDAAAMGPIAALCSHLLLRFTPAQQLRTLSSLLAVANALLTIPVNKSGAEAVADANAAVFNADTSSSAAASGADASAESDDAEVALLLPLVLSDTARTAPAPGTAPSSKEVPLTPSQRLVLALTLLRFAAAHMAAREFLVAALAASTAPVSADKITSPGQASGADRMQRQYLLLSEGLFDVLQLAADASEAVTASRISVVKAGKGSAAGPAAARSQAKPAKAPAANAADDQARTLAHYTMLLHFWSRVADACYAVLNRLSTLLAPASFVAVVATLLHHESSAIRRRSLQFLTEHLRSNYGNGASSSLTAAEVLLYVQLLPDLIALLQQSAADAGEEPEPEVNKQIALDAIAALATFFASTHVEQFVPALAAVTAVLNTPASAVALQTRGSAFLCAAVLCKHLGPRALPHLPTLVPRLCECVEWSLGSAADEQSKQDAAAVPAVPGALSAVSSDAASDAVIALRLACMATLRIWITGLPQFLSAYLARVLRLTLHPKLIGPLPAPPLLLKWERRVNIDAAGKPVVSVPAYGEAAEAGPRAVLPGKLATELENATVSTPVAVAAAEVVTALGEHVEARVLLPALLSAYAPAAAAGPHSVVLLLRALTRLAVKLPGRDLREQLPNLFRFLLSVFDYRWRYASAAHLATLVAASSTTAAAALDTAAQSLTAHAAGACAVETESLTLFLSIIVRLGDAQLRPLLLRLLQWAGQGAAEVRTETVVEGVKAGANMSADEEGEDSPWWSFAQLSRRVVLYRVFEATVTVARSLFVPYFVYLLPEAANDLAATAATAETGKAKSAAADASSSSTQVKRARTEGGAKAATAAAGKGRRVRFAGGSDDEEEAAEEEAAAQSDDEDEDDETAAAEEQGAAKSGGALSGASSDSVAAATTYLSLVSLDGLCAQVAGHAADVNCTPHALLPPTSVHTLRVCILASLHACFLHDTAADPDGFMSKGGKDRLTLLLRPLMSQVTLPLATTTSGSAAVGAASSAKLAGKKRGRDAAAASGAAAPAYLHDGGSGAGNFELVLRAGLPGGLSGYRNFISTYMVPLVGALTSALRKDTLWKPLNNSLLLLTRDDKPRVRLAALQCVTQLFTRGSDEALVLLPETLPFLSEVQNDDDTECAAACHSLLRLLEIASGEDLQQYLS